jgi:glucose/arabinose dehydrogenase/cytochrome c5
MHKLPTLLSFLFIVFFGFTSCSQRSSTADKPGEGSPDEGQEQVLSEAAQSRAAENYESYCAGCHGEELEAFVDREWKYGDSREDIFTAINEGIPADGMPSFAETFSEEEIKALVSYIKQGIREIEEYSFEEQEHLPEIIRTEELSFRLDTMVSGLGIIWGMAFLPDGDMLLTEKSGNIYRLTSEKELQNISGGPEVLDEGQGGLLDIALHPDFSQNKVIYLSYSAYKEEIGITLSTTAIMRAVLDGNNLKDQQVIFEALPYQETRHHYGSRLAFGRDGLLYFSVGDRGQHEDELPQRLDNHMGKIHRIMEDGGIPEANPFLEEAKAYPSIYSYGHRNPQGLTIHPQSGALWQHEHGPRGGDELHVIEEAKNYGWPVISYGINYDGTVLTDKTAEEGMEQPLHYWVPSIAPSGMTFVSGGRYKGWEGDLLIGSLRFQYLNRCKMDGTKVVAEEKVLQKIGRVRDVKMGPDAYIYVSVEDPGRIYRLLPQD